MGMYFNVQRFSTHDGDGIRTVLFLKGCPLRCPWCQNPESCSDKRSLFFDRRLCLNNCQLCCELSAGISLRDEGLMIDRKQISASELISLTTVCPTKALTVCGQEVDTDALFLELMKDKPFFDQSSGGITFSGGEPLMQADLVAELAQRCHEQQVSTAIETCMHVPWRNIDAVAPHIDCWMADLKHTHVEKFSQWTRGSAERVMENFHRLDRIAKRIIIRVPIVPEFNDSVDELNAIIDFSASLKCCSEIHFLPYHTLGMNKYELLGLPYECSKTPLQNNELVEHAYHYARFHAHLNVVIRG